MDTVTLGMRIRDARLSLGMTQEELAEKLNTTKQSIGKYENGIVTNIPLNRIYELAAALQTTPAFLLFGDDGEGFDLESQLSQKAIDFGRRAAALPPEKQVLLEAYLQALKDI